MELSIIKIAWHFSTADGQQVKDFSLYTMEEDLKNYNQLLVDIVSAVEVAPTDLRFVLQALQANSEQVARVGFPFA